MKHEMIKEEQAVEENPTVGIEEAVSRDLPPATETGEVLVSQEWVEMCEQQRLPVKQKYQLQFKETMCLNMEVRKLRKQVHKLQKWMKKYKRQAKKYKAIVVEAKTQVDNIATTSAATQTDPVEQLFLDCEYALMAEV